MPPEIHPLFSPIYSLFPIERISAALNSSLLPSPRTLLFIAKPYFSNCMYNHILLMKWLIMFDDKLPVLVFVYLICTRYTLHD